MKDYINILRATRGNLKKVMEGLSESELIAVPNGYRNSVIWNAGHAITTCDLLVYGRAGLPMRLEADFKERYRKGTFPDGTELRDLEFILKELDNGIEDLARQIHANHLITYDPYMTSYNFQLNSWEDAIQFNNVHEALHLGYVMAMVKSL